MWNKFAVLVLLLLLSRLEVLSQTSVNMGSQPTVTGCDINIYDDGGSTGDYAPNHTYTLTIFPTANQGRVFLEINSLDIHHNDTLYIFDGTSVSAPLIAALNNSTYNSNLNTGNYMASQNNTSGAVTLRFKTSFFLPVISQHGSGFAMHAFCVPGCNPFNISLDTSRCSHLPVLNPEDSYYYIDLCSEEPLTLAVKGNYSNSSVSGYTQSDATTTFKWNLESDLTMSGVGLDSVTHLFPPGSGYEVSILATDTLSCLAQLPVAFRVRTSANPIQGTFHIPQLCLGQEFAPSVGPDDTCTIVLHDVGFVQPVSLAVYDTVFLPDGENCPPYGLYYRSNVTFTEFAPGATLTDANDILYVRLKMEHSAVEDIKIQIFCPNGSSSTILPFPNFESTYDESTMPITPQYFRVNLGSAYRPDGEGCNANINPMGEPWNYVWSNNNTLGYQYASDNGNLISPGNFTGHYNPHWDTELSPYFDSFHSYSIDSSNVAAMTQIYHPYQNFNSLVGCPLNGNWYIQVQDMLSDDNGYIVEWELALNPELVPSSWSFDLNLDSVYFTGNQVVNNNVLRPAEVGEVPYTITVLDDFGCQYDTTFHITVLPLPEVSLREDMTVCPGASVYIGPVLPNNNYQYTWNTGSTAPGIFVSEPGAYSVTASISGTGVTCSSSDTFELLNFVLSDTTFLWDTICEGYDYEEYGYFMSAAFLSQFDHPSQSQNEFTGIQTAQDQHGCDSIVLLRLTVYRHWEKEETVLACEQYIWGGETLTESGDYVKNFVSQHGCDSTVTLHLGIGYPSESEFWETACGSYLWDGETFMESGDYVKTFSSIHGCDSVVTLHLTVVDTVLRTASSNPDFCVTEETTITVEGTFDTYRWSTGESGNSILVTSSGTYTVTATNYACERSATVTIPFCPPTLLLPNAITPSVADGLNDVFALSERDRNNVVEFSIYIFNRWGELVFFSEDKNFGWDGTLNGKLVRETVYNYVIRCTDRTGKPYRVTGTVTVL